MTSPNTRFRLLSRNRKWVSGATISEYVNDENTRRFTATIRGWSGWFLWEGDGMIVPLNAIISKATEIRDRIDGGDDGVFELSNKTALVSYSIADLVSQFCEAQDEV